MDTLVHKYGGTSVANLKHIKQAARLVQQDYKRGKRLVVVVSAMAGQTDQLDRYAKSFGIETSPEYDVVVSSGEQVASGLMALALQSVGVPARSVMGWQIPIHTDSSFSRARIQGVELKLIRSILANKMVAVVPGFQGIDPTARITTLGRGGSDTTAVALAVALKAKRCLIYTDVEGVYTADPRIVPNARKLTKVTYEEMLELASLGSKVLHHRSVELAMKNNVELEVRLAPKNAIKNKVGTLITKETKSKMEAAIITGISHDLKEAKITLIGVADKPGVAGLVFGSLSDVKLNVDMIVQNVSEDGTSTDLTFTVASQDAALAKKCLEASQKSLKYKKLVVDKNVAKISIVGTGMRSAAGVASTMFKTLAKGGINIQVISTSEIKISVLIEKSQHKKALTSLHKVFIQK